jgi:4-carboxymuconolactone decarboxylase
MAYEMRDNSMTMKGKGVALVTGVSSGIGGVTAQLLGKAGYRLPLIPPDQLDGEQRPFYDDMREEIARDFQGFKAIDDSGRLIGPFNVWLRAPKWGRPIWDFVKSIAMAPTLPGAVREVAILVTAAHFRAAYAIYAHVALAERGGLDDEKLATIIAGERPSNLTHEESVAYDVASALASGRVLPVLTYRQAVAAFGESSTMELIYLIGAYCLVSVTLNGFDIRVPDEESL